MNERTAAALESYLRSPVALGWTFLGVLAVGSVAAGGWLFVETVRASLLGSTTGALDGTAGLLSLVAVPVLLVAIAVVWLPFGAGVAHAVGRRTRGRSVSFRESLDVVLDVARPLAGWLQTRVAVGPLADRLLSADDVAPGEVAVGCAGFVVPALVLDSPSSLPVAVERANRVTPRPGRGRLLAGGLGVTVLVAGGVYAGRSVAPSPVGDVATQLAVGVVLVGCVVTAALDAAWRAEVYASGDRSGEFSS